MVLLPRLARALNAPAIATGDIRTGYAVIILIVGVINVIRAVPHPGDSR